MRFAERQRCRFRAITAHLEGDRRLLPESIPRIIFQAFLCVKILLSIESMGEKAVI